MHGARRINQQPETAKTQKQVSRERQISDFIFSYYSFYRQNDH